jgi:hypothetical protein
MGAIAAVLIAKLMDPIAIVLGFAAGWFGRVWWHFAITAVASAVIVEVVLYNTQLTHQFNPVFFVIGIFAAGIWVSIAFYIKKRRARSN